MPYEAMPSPPQQRLPPGRPARVCRSGWTGHGGVPRVVDGACRGTGVHSLWGGNLTAGSRQVVSVVKILSLTVLRAVSGRVMGPRRETAGHIGRSVHAGQGSYFLALAAILPIRSCLSAGCRQVYSHRSKGVSMLFCRYVDIKGKKVTHGFASPPSALAWSIYVL